MNGTLQVLISFAITWGIGLTPPLLARFVIIRRPIAKWPAIAVTALFWFCNLLIFTLLGSDTHTALLVVAWVTYLILRKEGQPQGDSGVEYPGERQVDHRAEVRWRPNGWIRIVIVITSLYCLSALLYGVDSYISYPYGNASHWFTADNTPTPQQSGRVEARSTLDMESIDWSLFDRIDPDTGELIKGVGTSRSEGSLRPPSYYAFFLTIVGFPAIFWGMVFLLFYGLRGIARWVAAGFEEA